MVTASDNSQTQAGKEHDGWFVHGLHCWESSRIVGINVSAAPPHRLILPFEHLRSTTTIFVGLFDGSKENEILEHSWL